MRARDVWIRPRARESSRAWSIGSRAWPAPTGKGTCAGMKRIALKTLKPERHALLLGYRDAV